MGASGRVLVEERFTWRAQAARLAAYYADLAGVVDAEPALTRA
jgi:hypothetical protein